MAIQLCGLRPNASGKVTAQWVNDRPVLVPSLREMFLDLESAIRNFPPEERFNLFYTIAHHTGAGTAVIPTRRKESFETQEVIVYDIDGIDVDRSDQYIEIAADALGIGSEAFTTVKSGNGVHMIVFLKDPITELSFFHDMKPHYQASAVKILRAIERMGLPLDPTGAGVDTSVFDPARILRLPGTENRKAGKPIRQSSLRNVALQPIQFHLPTVSGLGDLTSYITPAEIKRRYPKVDALTVMQGGCRFLQWFVAHPEEVHEPQAFDAMGLLAQMAGDSTSKEALLGSDAPNSTHLGLTLAERTIARATSSPSLQGAQFVDKWEQSCRYGGRRCATIERTAWEDGTSDAFYREGCRGCPFYQLVETPLEIKSDDFVTTDVAGYWTWEGKQRVPAYTDLLIKFEEAPYVVLPDSERLFRWKGTHYVRMHDLDIKAWIEETMVPKPKNIHRMEFMHKVFSNNIVDASFFTSNIINLVNLQNGVLDITTGQLRPHSPTLGFRSVLPFPFDPTATCPTFDVWIKEITLNRRDLERTLIDLMAYCLYPAYPDACFAFLIGGGSNGKSTFLRILKALLGKENISSVNISQLLENRFMLSTLDGKLANLSAESGARTLSPEAVQRLKELTGNDEITVEVKHGHPYSMVNHAKLIFACNELPKLGETTEAIFRREVVVPFEMNILSKAGGENSNIEDTIIAREMPGIMNRCLQALGVMRQNVSGAPKVYRGGEVVHKAKLDHVIEGSSVLSWFNDHVDITGHPDDIMIIGDMFNRYQQDVKFSVQSPSRFMEPIRRVFLEPRLPDAQMYASDLRMSSPDGRRHRVIKGLKWKDEGDL